MAAFMDDSSLKVGMFAAYSGLSGRPDYGALACRRRVPPHSQAPSGQAVTHPKHNHLHTASLTICTAGVETTGWPLRGGDAETG